MITRVKKPRTSTDILRHHLRALFVTVLATLFFGMAGAGVSAEQQKPRTILEMLFGINKPVEEAPKPPKKKKKPVSASVGDPNAAKVVPLPKLATASKVLVVGDFLAKGIGTGLDAAFVNSPGIAIETRGNGPAGLVRDDLFDWATLLPGYINEVKPAMIIISLGANDRQQMKINAIREKFKSDNWSAEYEKRVMALAKIATDQKIPLLWVGLPSFSAPTMMADAVTLNSIIQSGVNKSGAEFVDIWEGFVDDTGKFVASGSDINGQQVRLRSSDGFGFTEAGKRKVAFYLEKPVRKILGTAAEIGTNVIGQSNLPELILLPPVEVAKTVRTAPMNVLDPEMDGSSKLLGDTTSGHRVMPSSLVTDAIGKAPKGRIDDFSLPAK